MSAKISGGATLPPNTPTPQLPKSAPDHNLLCLHTKLMKPSKIVQQSLLNETTINKKMFDIHLP